LLGSYTQGLTGAYSPFSTGIGVGSSLESLGQAPLDIGAQLGGRSAQAGANVGQTLLSGGTAGARTTQAASGFSPAGTAITGLANSPQFGEFITGQLNPLTPEERQVQDAALKNYQDQAAAYRARGGQGVYIPGVTG
jgi:hypothetical protein